MRGRNKPVARIVPCRLQGHSEAATGCPWRSHATLAERVVPLSWPEPPGNISDEGMGQVWWKEPVMRVPVFWGYQCLVSFPPPRMGRASSQLQCWERHWDPSLLTGSLHQEGGVVSFAIGISVSYSLLVRRGFDRMKQRSPVRLRVRPNTPVLAVVVVLTIVGALQTGCTSDRVSPSPTSAARPAETLRQAGTFPSTPPGARLVCPH